MSQEYICKSVYDIYPQRFTDSVQNMAKEISTGKEDKIGCAFNNYNMNYFKISLKTSACSIIHSITLLTQHCFI